MQCLIATCCTDIESCKGKKIRIWLKSRATWQQLIDVWHLHGVYAACQGLSDLGNGPNQPTVTIIGECSASLQHAAPILSLVRARNSGFDKNLEPQLWQHIIDVWHLPGVYAACKGLADLGNGPNQPTATIIGEYSASLQHAALMLSLVRARNSGFD